MTFDNMRGMGVSKMTMSAISENPQTLWIVPIYIIKTVRRRQFCDFYRQSSKDHKLQNEKKIYIFTSQKRRGTLM